jgi:HSP20 family protein
MSIHFPVIRSHLNRDFNDIFSSFFDNNRLDSFLSSPRRSYASQDSVPKANIQKIDKGYSIQLAAPGFSRDDFTVDIEDNILTIGANKSTEKEDDDYTSREFSYSSFNRSWTLPEGSSTSGLAASYEAGILSVDIPIQHEETKKITVQVS